MIPVKAQEKQFIIKTGKLSMQNKNQELYLRKLKKEIKKAQVRPAKFRMFMNKTFAPKLSVDLLDNKGIHLFTITDLDPIPTISVGARINAGLIITL